MRGSQRFSVPQGFFARSRGLPHARHVSVRTVSVSDDEYPDLLRHTPGAPKRFYVAGADLRALEPRVAVIGARNATPYGLNVAESLSRELAAHGVTIVSGLARGADSAAHDGALSAGGKTIAVVATGPDVCYPPSSSVLFAEILASDGAIVSANPPGRSDVPRWEFIVRNELMIALCPIVVVVQGGAESAAVATGGKALEKNREVFAVPGPIDSAVCAGTNGLLKESAARVCTGPDDILKTLISDYETADPGARPIPGGLPDTSRRVLEVLRDGPGSRETIVLRSGLDVVAASRAIASLEVDGLVAVVNEVVRRV